MCSPSAVRAYADAVPGFTPSHRGGSGPPLVLLHGFLDTWRSWELVLPRLERRHDVLALTLAGHAGGPRIDGPVHGGVLADAVERQLDAAGIATAHFAGNSLGGHVALQLAGRGRARSVVALAPAGGWAPGDDAFRPVLAWQASLAEAARGAALHADAIAATPEGRRRATAALVTDPRHIPPGLVAHLVRAVSACTAAEPLIAYAHQHGWSLDAAAIACPVRVVWGTEDALLRWPGAAARYRDEWLPHADWVVLDGVGHCPQLEVPLEAAELILGWTAP
jgi:pimeloyl-ACP methyl ester carboxylesterase